MKHTDQMNIIDTILGETLPPNIKIERIVGGFRFYERAEVRDALRDLQRQGIVGVAFNPALHGLAHYADIDGLLGRLADLGPGIVAATASGRDRTSSSSSRSSAARRRGSWA